jgi:hypothetical protein
MFATIKPSFHGYLFVDGSASLIYTGSQVPGPTSNTVPISVLATATGYTDHLVKWAIKI